MFVAVWISIFVLLVANFCLAIKVRRLEGRRRLNIWKGDDFLNTFMGNSSFQMILKEWAVQIETGCDATTFASLYLEMMRDEKDCELRKVCTLFATYMKARSWDAILASLTPFLDANLSKTFGRPEAREFYGSFKAMVIYQIKDYWEQFVASKRSA